MRIAQIAPPFESIPPAKYGGTECVVSALTETLVQRGHQVTLFASGDSVTRARLVTTVDQALWHHSAGYRDFLPFWSTVLGKATQHLDEFDIIHSHLDHLGFPLARLAPCPVVTTLHGRLDLPELQPLYEEFADVPLVSISDAQRRPVPWANWVATIYHGIDLDAFTFNPQPGTYLAFLGRISPEKRLDAAIDVALKAGVPLKIAARMPLPFNNDPNVRADWEYYEQCVKPLIQQAGSQVEFIGEVGGREKDVFLGNALALLFPVHWPEPFGLVMAEALACGTPVLACGNGSVPEVITHGVTGLICDSDDQLVDAVEQVSEIDRYCCRQEAEQRFSLPAMAAQYEQVYECLCASYLDRPSVRRADQVTPLPTDPVRSGSDDAGRRELTSSCAVG